MPCFGRWDGKSNHGTRLTETLSDSELRVASEDCVVMTRKLNTVRICFVAVIVAGLASMVVGLAVMPFRYLFQLDAVLTPAELRDPQVCESTAALLKNAAGNEWLLWTLFGIIQMVIGTVGLLASSKIPSHTEVARQTDGKHSFGK